MTTVTFTIPDSILSDALGVAVEEHQSLEEFVMAAIVTAVEEAGEDEKGDDEEDDDD